MLKILVTDINYTQGVNRESTLIKINYWQKRGAKVFLLCSTEAKEFYQEKLHDVEFFTFPFTWRSKTRWTVPLDYIRANILVFPYIFKMKGKFDVIYSLSSTLDFIFFPWILQLIDQKIRWFAVMDNIVPKPSERPGNYILKLIPYVAFLIGNILLKKADGIFVVTNILKEYYETKGIRVVKTGNGYGLDIDSFKGTISSGTPRFNALFGARLHPAKGIFDLVAIIKEVVKKDKNFTLGIMGHGDEKTKKKLQNLIKTYKLSNNIFLLGHKNTKERWDLYRNSGFFLFPSYAEGCPQVVLEAFAANRLVVAYDLPEYRDVFNKYIKNGELVLFKKGLTEEIANYISKFNVKKHVFKNKLKDFTWDVISNKELKSFYEINNKNIS